MASISWIIALTIGIISITLASEDGQFFFASEVCIGIPIIRRDIHLWQTDYIKQSKTIFDTVVAFKPILQEDISLFYWYSPSLRREDKGFEHNNSFQWIQSADFIVHMNQESYTEYITNTISIFTGNRVAPIFSIVSFIGINLVCFLTVLICYIEIFRCVKKSSVEAGVSQNHKQEFRIAWKMFRLILTDFCCWVPLCVACIFAQGNIIEISADIYVWISGFILPINSSINPFLYVIVDKISDYFDKRRPKLKGNI